jgi:hypothetical protein
MYFRSSCFRFGFLCVHLRPAQVLTVSCGICQCTPSLFICFDCERYLQVVIDNWTNQPYQDNHGTNITEVNNTIVVSWLHLVGGSRLIDLAVLAKLIC